MRSRACRAPHSRTAASRAVLPTAVTVYVLPASVWNVQTCPYGLCSTETSDLLPWPSSTASVRPGQGLRMLHGLPFSLTMVIGWHTPSFFMAETRNAPAARIVTNLPSGWCQHGNSLRNPSWLCRSMALMPSATPAPSTLPPPLRKLFTPMLRKYPLHRRTTSGG